MMIDNNKREIRKITAMKLLSALIRIGFVIFIIYMTIMHFAK